MRAGGEGVEDPSVRLTPSHSHREFREQLWALLKQRPGHSPAAKGRKLKTVPWDCGISRDNSPGESSLPTQVKKSLFT